MAAILIPKVLHPFTGIEVAVGGRVELTVLHGNAAAGIIPAAVSIDGLPLRLIAEITIIHSLTAKVKRPITIRIELDGIVVVVCLAQPDTLKAAEVIYGIFGKVTAQPLVGVVLQGSLFLSLAAACQQGKA